jgi:hypothetical protein
MRIDAEPARQRPWSGTSRLAVAVPAILAFVSAAVARMRPAEAALWAVASLALTGGLVLVLLWFVQTYVPT